MKERLTGALILVALLVILVPEILPGPVAERSAGDATPAATADGPPLRSYSMDLGSPDRATVADQSALAPQPATPQAAAPQPAEPSPPAATPPATTSDEPLAGSKGKPDAPVAVQATPAPAAAVPATAEAAAASGAWWVQLGVFSQTDNARRLVQSLTKAGFHAQMSPLRANGKELYRVRAGPVGDRAAAEALKARLAEAGHKGTLVAP